MTTPLITLNGQGKETTNPLGKPCSSQFKGVSKTPYGTFQASFWNPETKKNKSKTFKTEIQAGNWWDERMKDFYKNKPDGKFIIINNKNILK